MMIIDGPAKLGEYRCALPHCLECRVWEKFIRERGKLGSIPPLKAIILRVLNKEALGNKPN